MRKKIALAFFCFIAFLVSACGSGGSSDNGDGGSSGPSYTGTTSQAVIDENNAQALAVAAADSSSSGDYEDQLSALFENTFSNLQSQKSAITAQGAVSGNCGGSATYPDDLAQQQSPITGSVSFSNFCLSTQSGQLIVNGRISFTIVLAGTELDSLSMEMENLVISFNGETVTINSSVTFSGSSVSFETSTDFVGSDGQTLRVENLVISGSPSTGITISSGRIYHPVNGYVDINTAPDQPLVFDEACNGHPMSGTLQLEGSGGTSADVVFDCTTYEVCLSGTAVCTPYTWE